VVAGDGEATAALAPEIATTQEPAKDVEIVPEETTLLPEEDDDNLAGGHAYGRAASGNWALAWV
jgi:hypothetical protein